ncbi:MAG TPA: ABC transporter permease [Candidatus Acidoferrales bacterium]|nr:ABC transporter permease [Candidatus Acidoferrales bacterium]
MGGFWSDLRYGWRILRHNPGFAIVAVATLAIGIGANAAIFSMVRGVLLQPLPFPHSDRLLLIWETDANLSSNRGTVASWEYLDWRERTHAFQQMGAYGARSVTLVGSDGTKRQIWQILTSANFFRMFEVQPVLGRDFAPDEETAGHNGVVLLSYRFWQQNYDGDPHVIGRSIVLSETPYTIIGVLPRGFSPFGGEDYLDVWAPFAFTRDPAHRDQKELVVFGRLRDGFSLRQAQAEMETIQAGVRREYPDLRQGTGIRVVRLQDDLNRNVRGALLLLSGAVGLVLLIACANVANLMLARAAGRTREIAVRGAIGAGRLRIIRQLLTESALLAALGGTLGILLGYAGLRLLLLTAPPGGALTEITRGLPIRMDGAVLGYAVVITVATGLIFGLAPAVQVSRSPLPEALKEGGRASSEGRRGKRLRSALVIAEMALSVLLLVAAGLLIRSFQRIAATNLGFDPSHVLTAELELPQARYKSAEQVENFYRALFARASALPGVQSAGGVNYLPMTSWTGFRDFDIAGRPAARPGSEFTSQYRVVVRNYLHTMRIAVLEGRDFSTEDGPGTAGVALINRALQRRYWPNDDAIGKQIRLKAVAANPYDAQTREDWVTIVGVVGDTQDWRLGEKPLPMLYVPESQNPSRVMRIVLRTAGDPTRAVAGLRSAVASVDSGLPLAYVTSMERLYRSSIAPQRMNAILLGILAGIATLLAAVGIYGVMSYGVSKRTHEIGIRLAIGATPASVRRMVLAEGMRQAGIGLAIGIGGALWLVRYLQSQLYGVSDRDPATFVCAAIGLAVVAAAACYIPARRATRVDPLVALREE